MPRGQTRNEWLLKRLAAERAPQEIIDAVRRQLNPSSKTGSGGYKDISPLLLMLKASQMSKHPKMSLLIDQAGWIRGELFAWITSYSAREQSEGLGFQLFRYHWKLIRSWMPLQLRLAAEQIFYELGGEYRKLITGFRPLD